MNVARTDVVSKAKNFGRRLSMSIQKVAQGNWKKEQETEEVELQVVRYKPEGIDALVKATKFTKKEIQLMYRGFKQECPTGIVNRETFKNIYAQFFPQGDSAAYAQLVFNTFDQDKNGTISFEEFVIGLSVLSRGSLQEKLEWVFSLYDVNGDGVITKQELAEIVTAVYEMMGKHTDPPLDENTTRLHVDRVFQRMDLNNDGVITIEEFMDSCKNDARVKHSMAVLDTVL